MTQTLPKAITEYIEASNSFDGDRLIAAFADDALVNDVRREFSRRDPIKRWADQEIIGDKVTMDVKEVKQHYGEVIVVAVMDGEYDKTNLPVGDLVLTHYFAVCDDKIVTLFIIANASSEN